MKNGDEARASAPVRTESSDAVATVMTLTPSSLQQQQRGVQQYVITGAVPIMQATSITQAAQLQQARPQLFAQVQGIQPIAPQQVQTSYQLSADVGKSSASAVVVSSVPTAVQIQSPALTNTLQRHLTSQGVLSLPALSPGRAYPQSSSSLIHHVASTASTLSVQKSPVLASSPQLHHQPQDGAAQHPLASVSGSSSVSASGGTIHHHGHSPSRGALPPLANPQQLLAMNINISSNQSGFSSPQQQAQVQQRRLSGSGGGGIQNRTSPVAAVLGGSSSSSGGGTTFILQSPQASPDRPRKRIKLEEMPPASTQAANYRKLILDHKHREMLEIKETYHEHLTELFFLQNGGNIMDYFQWKKRPTVQLVQFLKSGNLDSDDEDEVHGHEKRINDEVKIITSSGSNTPLATPVAISTTLPAAVASLQHQQQAGDHSRKLGGRHGMIFGHLHPGSTVPAAAQTSQTQHASHAASSSSAITTTTPSAAGVTSTVQQTPQTITITATLPYPSPLTTSSIATPTSTTKSTRTVMTASTTPTISSDRYTGAIKAHPPVTVKKETPESSAALSISQVLRQATTTASSLNTSLGNSVTKAPKTSTSPNKSHSRQHSISAVYEHTLGSQEAIVERAKQEAQVMQRIADLRKEGLWSSRRLPKVQEPVRNKAHWDYLLEEMQWLAADFAQERKWKKAASRKIARMIMRYFQEQQQKEQRAEKEEGMRTKRIASNLAKQIKEFWLNIEKVVQYKQQSRLEEKRKKALDVHLNFIVDQTEKYSSWLSEGLTANSTVSSHTGSKNTSPSHSIADVDFEPEREESTDDEETIEREEETYGVDKEGEKAEVEALKKESEVPIEDLLKSLPPEVLSNEEPPEKGVSKEDDEFVVSSNDEDAEDEEETLAEQEKHEKAAGYDEEMDDLKAENEMSVEELMKKYSGAYDSDFEMPESESEVSSSEEEEESEDAESDDAETNEELSEGSDAEAEQEDAENVGMEYLINPEAEQPELVEKESTGPKKEITDIAAAAMSIQPTGYTFDTTQVKTPVPFLLKHKLREYQHVGMEWLATMHERKLNGILADEMGLGKTIQTIAMLANLACQHGTWGPHLIVVPTSVMLNWEMELKKWCPAFKILTYYGNQKERKMKRQGWTKTNAFHVCITSYKLVIQDHQSFRRKKWKYLILDEAQNIKNFKSQRWQTLLNFSSQRRLLLTGTPLQNSLMELWSLMHFLMPHVFQSHREFKEWFSNPLSGMIEGSHEYNESLVKRLHKVLRPFLLRRLKIDVEKQMPQKYEHVVMCRLSKRQRYLYDDFMSQTKTKETLQTGHFMSVINILMQLRKVCNHPNLFDPRPIVSPFQMEGITFSTASLVTKVLEFDPLKNVDFFSMYSCLGDLELTLPAFAAHRIKKLQTPRKLIVEIDSQPEPTPRLKPLVKPKPLVFRSMSPMTQVCKVSGRASPFSPIQPSTLSSPIVARSAALSVTSQPLSRASPVMTQAGGPLKSLVSAVPTAVTSATDATTLKSPVPQPAKEVTSIVSSGVSSTITPSSGNLSHVLTSQPITVQIHHTQQGTRLMIPSDQLSNLPGFIHIVQTSNVQSAVSSSQQQASADLSSQTLVVNGPAVSAVSSPLSRPSTTAVSAGTVLTQSLISAKHTPAIQLPSATTNATTTNGKPVVRVSPMSSAPPTSTSFITLTSADQTKVAGKTVSLQPTSSVLKPSTGTTSKPVATTTLVSATPSATTATRVVNQTANTKKLKEKSPFYLKELEEKRCQRRTHKLERIASINKRRSEVKPVYGQDFCHAVNIFCDSPYNNRTNSYAKPAEQSSWHGQGFLHCHNVHSAKRPNHPNHYWTQTDALSRIVHTPEMYLEELDSIINRYVFVTPTVCAPPIRMHTCHPSPSQAFAERKREFLLHQELAPKLACLHKICSNMHVQFPELRLIQYDCGKLQTMDLLLRKLKNGGHRVLIFTQMTKMLDVLEAFLNYHGHRYLRLDGTTNVEKRQALMERFNMDRRIFCFILSTRSGGIGVNLTGADTVIFYDSDWNPTMDAQAQDRCHRIGQTRDVHIYRLISDKTIEENILKKANQKRLLGDVAIEGGNFTTAFFKQNTLSELFDEPSGLDALAKEKASREIKMAAQRKTTEQAESHLTTEQMEQALCHAEDETDVQAAKVVHAEQKAELAEFDEEIPWDERESSEQKERQDEEVSRVEMELAMLDKELTPVERYAVLYMEKQMEPLSDELEKAEEEVAMAKEEWELGRLKIMKEEEERRAELEEDEMLFTYSRDDAYNQMYICDENSEYMPMWAPPTPPQDDNDIYIDQTICFLFEPSIMPESQLPPIFVKKEHKRVRVDPNSGRKQKVRKDDQIRVPRSLFDRPTAALQKMRREAKLQRLKQGLKPTIKSLPSLSSSKPMLETGGDHPEWLIHEDWALLQAVQFLQELPLNLMIVNPAHIPNWDMVSDIVNVSSRLYRSSRQCKNRYETVIVPREEGKILYDINPRKQKKSKGIYKTKNNRPMRTSQLYIQDNYLSLTTLHNHRFDTVKAASAKRTPTLKSTLANPTHKNPKHAAVLASYGITNYDQPSTPIQVATIRAERIAREKKTQAVNAAAAEQLQQAQRVAQQQQQAQAQAQGTATSAQPTATLVQAQQLQPAASATNTATLQPSAIQKAGVATGITAVSLARTLGTNIVVNTPAGTVQASPFATINKRVASLAQTTTVALTGTLTQAVRARTASGMMVHDLSAAIAGQPQARAVSHATTSTLLTTAALTPTQLVAAQRVGAVTAITTVASGTTTVQQQLAAKNLTPQQLAYIRQQALQRQKQRTTTYTPAQAEQLKRLQQQAAAQGVTVTSLQKNLGVTTPLSITQTSVTQAPRLQVSVAKSAGLKQMTRPATEAEMALLFRRQQQQQQKASGQTSTQTVHQIQLTPQLFAQAQIPGQAGTQPVATLVKTVPTPGSIPSVTIPVTVGGVNINVSVPQKATTVPKATAVNPQLRTIQQLQQRKVTAAPLQPQKVTTLSAAQIQQVAAASGTPLQTPLIIQQPQQKQVPTMTVQQIRQFVKQQQQAQSGRTSQTIQQIISGVPPAVSTATIIASQLFSQSQPTSSKLSLPVTALVTSARTVTPVAVNASPSVTVSAITTTPTVTVTTIPAMTASPSTTLTLGAGSKSLEQVVVSPAKMVTQGGAVVQQVKTFQTAQIQGSSQVTQVQVQATPHLQLQTTPTGVTHVQLTPHQVQVHKPATITQTINQVQQQQQATVTTPVTVTQVPQQQAASTTQQPQAAAQPAQAAATLQVSQQSVQQIQVTTDPQNAQSKASPYTMRLRNSRS